MAGYDELLAEELQEGEEVVEQIAGDYWKYAWIFGSQERGRYFFTNKRILFFYFGSKAFEIPYSDIASAQLCMVGPLIRFVPCGIKVTTKDEKTYHLSVMKRAHYLDMILNNMAK